MIDQSDRDFYIAKFSTLYNYTEWFRQSRLPDMNETVRGLIFDSDNEIAFMAVEVNTNNYMKATIYDTYANIAFTN